MKIKIAMVGFGLLLGVAIACNNTPKTPAWDATPYRERGLELAGITQTTMSTQLKKALEEGGVPIAVQYCNLAAYSIVDSLSKIHNATIRRVTDKPRSPNNSMTAHEQKIFNQFQSQWHGQQQVAPIVEQLQNGEVAFYAPIGIQALCTKCHGKLGETLTTENYAVIQQLYPTDKAIGYAEGDLRGMWRIVMQ
ncbi:MAG: DUF3365 domain-containing protein [Saprospiraceae bacterium]